MFGNGDGCACIFQKIISEEQMLHSCIQMNTWGAWGVFTNLDDITILDIFVSYTR